MSSMHGFPTSPFEETMTMTYSNFWYDNNNFGVPIVIFGVALVNLGVTLVIFV